MPFNRVSRRFLILVLVAGLVAATPVAVSALDPGGTFTDDDDSIHEGAIEAIAADGITKGCNPPVNDLFCPGATVTREQMATFLARGLDLPAGSASFTDIGNSVHAANIEALATAGVTRGCNPPDNTLFCPFDRVTREQMATFLVRALDLPAGSGSFTDTGDSVHAANIDALAAAGITKGCNPPDNTLFCPNDPVTREQMATFLTRALDLTPMTPPDPLPDDVPGDLVLIGDDSWLYFDETVTQTCLGINPYSRLVAEIDKAAEVVEASGRDFVYAVAPNKATVYPDYVPGYVGSCAKMNSDLLYSVLSTSVDPNRVNLVDPFRAATDPLYWKHDTHWDATGALLGSELIATIAAPGVWDQLDLVSSAAMRQGDLATILGVEWVIAYTEQTPTLSGVTPTVSEESATISGRPLITYSSTASPELSDQRTIVIHDSFGMFFRNKLGPLFENVTFIPTFTHPIPDDGASFVEDSEQIVIEVVERNVLRDFIGTGTASTLAALLSDDFTPTAVTHTRAGEQINFTIPAGSPGDLRYLIVELDTSVLTGPIFIGDPSVVDIATDEGAWPDEITPDTTKYGFEVMVESGAMAVPLPSSLSVSAAYVIVVE